MLNFANLGTISAAFPCRPIDSGSPLFWALRAMENASSMESVATLRYFVSKRRWIREGSISIQMQTPLFMVTESG